MEKIKSGLLGVIVGDALGLPVQFKERTWFYKHPVTDMMGLGVFNKPKGSWSDDGSLTLALAASLSKGYDPIDIMEEFSNWLFYGKYTQDHQAYDIGQTTANAIMNYHRGIPINKCGGKSYYDNGNGSLMRILPLVFYLRVNFGDDFTSIPDAMHMIHEVSSLTHAHELAKMACGIYLSIANELLKSIDIENAVRQGIMKAIHFYNTDLTFQKVKNEFNRLEDLKQFKNLDESKIGSSGFVKDTLEASLWCLLNTSSYEEAVLKAVNLGYDTDTTAAVCGGLAALAYDKINLDWIKDLRELSIVEEICDSFEQSLIKEKAV